MRAVRVMLPLFGLSGCDAERGSTAERGHAREVDGAAGPCGAGNAFVGFALACVRRISSIISLIDFWR